MSAFWQALWRRLPYFLEVLAGGAVTTLQVTAGALVLAIAVGLVLALAKISRVWPLRAFATSYIELFRGTPALTQLFVIYFGLAEAGIYFQPLQAAIIGLGLNGGAYLAEVFRAGIQAIHRGQMEAALSIGMTPRSAMLHIVLPQAVRIVLPPIGNYAIGLLKDTAIVASVAAPEIMFRARNLVMETYLSMQIYLLVALLYLAMSLPLSHAVARLERRMRMGRA